ncbi:hypothetical protein D9M68_696880 [compost metagenome]
MLRAAVLVQTEVVEEIPASAHSDDPQHLRRARRRRLVCTPSADHQRAAVERIHDGALVAVGPVAQRRWVGQQPVWVRRAQRKQVHHLKPSVPAGQRPLHAPGDGRVVDLVVSCRWVEHDEAQRRPAGVPFAPEAVAVLLAVREDATGLAVEGRFDQAFHGGLELSFWNNWG